MFTIYSADITGNPGNCSYPNRHEITDESSLRPAVCHDYVCAEYKNNYRNNDNFICSDCLPFDCDNSHSDDPDDWVTPKDVAETFKGVSFAVHYSRNNEQDKNGKTARPRFHILFEIDKVTDLEVYKTMKKLVNAIFPYFDIQAMDAARFFFGTSAAEVEIHNGSLTLTDFLQDFEAFDKDMSQGEYGSRVITEGNRNAAMSRFAGKVIKKYGDTPEAYNCFIKESEKCSPPLDASELETIWHSAQKFYYRISSQEGYISPEVYNDTSSYKPEDYTDLGQAKVLAKYFYKELRFSKSLKYLHYTENYWKETNLGAQAVVHELTRRQLNEAENEMNIAMKKMEANGAHSILISNSKSKAESKLNQEQLNTYKEFLEAKTYKAFVLKRRDSRYISSALNEAQPMLEISTSELDTDCFALCTPAATYDLRKGLKGARKHSPDDFITKITAVSPGKKGEKIWLDCLELIFGGNQELIDYVQMVCGLAVIGKVYIEALLIAYGDGGNGKSTFWNVISRVLGSYSGKISADALTVGCRRNIKPELAEARGKRMLIASESQEGARFNDSIVKQLCSTDDLFAEKKFKDPFTFTPCHTLVLYTNHLPRVSGNDEGIWRRLIVIPFNSKIEGKLDIKNYADYLFNNAGESILSWLIEGAKKVIDLEFHLPVPKCVKDAITEYHDRNDWFGQFIEDKCEIGDSFKESSSALYQIYRGYCIDTNEYVRSTADFYFALEKAGYKRITINRKRYIKGLRIRNDIDDFDDFLN